MKTLKMNKRNNLPFDVTPVILLIYLVVLNKSSHQVHYIQNMKKILLIPYFLLIRYLLNLKYPITTIFRFKRNTRQVSDLKTSQEEDYSENTP